MVLGDEHHAYLAFASLLLKKKKKTAVCLFSFLIIPVSPAKGSLSDEPFKPAGFRTRAILKFLVLAVS